MKTLYEEMRAERDDLQLEVWELEDLLEELLVLLAPPVSVSQPVSGEDFLELETVSSGNLTTAAALPAERALVPTEVDLSGLKLALVGGHDATRREVIQELSQRHGLTDWVELPPFNKHSLGKSNIKAKIHNCDLIVLITGYMRHKQTDSVVQLKKLGSLSGDVLLLNCRGKSGVVREILAYVVRRDC